MPKIVHFGEFFENLKLAVKQSYQTGQFYNYFVILKSISFVIQKTIKTLFKRFDYNIFQSLSYIFLKFKDFLICSWFFISCQIGLQSHFHLHQCGLFWSTFEFWICFLWIDNLGVLDQNLFCILCNILHTFHCHAFLLQCLVISLRVH